jgi:hypothetical protein
LVLPDGASRFGALVVDGQLKANGFEVVRVRAVPETYDVVEPGPPAWTELAPSKIALIQFVTGLAAEAGYGVCAGIVVIVITTSP